MSGKVFHVDDATHKLVHKYCNDNNFMVKEWVILALVQAVRDKFGLISKVSNEMEAPIKVANPDPANIILKKEELLVPTHCQDTQPWSQPPFWAKK